MQTEPRDLDISYLERAIGIALEAEKKGNLPIGAVITLGDLVISECGSSILVPAYHPGRHAEMGALGQVPVELWGRSREMTCYTTLEPCLMCYGALVLHGVGRVVFGASDVEGGAGVMRPYLPAYYRTGGKVPEWTGPVMPDRCDALYKRAKSRFDLLPCGKQ